MNQQKKKSLTPIKKILMIVGIICFFVWIAAIFGYVFTQNNIFFIIMFTSPIGVVLGGVAVKSYPYSGWKRLPDFYKESLEDTTKGTMNNPVIFGSTAELPIRIRIEKSNSFITFQDCDIPYLWLTSCQNIVLKNINFSFFHLGICQNITFINCRVKKFSRVVSCSRITFTDSTIQTSLRIHNCKGIKIEKCSIERLKLLEAENSTFRFCNINKIKNKLSKNNIFEDNSIPEKQFAHLNPSKFQNFADKWSIKTWFIFTVIFLPIFFIMSIFSNWIYFLPFALIIFFGLIGLFVPIKYFGEKFIKKKQNTRQ